jgi:thioredoxin-related protein
MRLLLFSRYTCGSCKKWLPVIQEISDELNLPLEILDDKEEMKKRSIKGLPTTILLDDEGNEIYSILGNVSKDKCLESIKYYIDGGKGD